MRLAWLVSAVISKDTPINFSGSSKSRLGVFSRVVVFLLKIYPLTCRQRESEIEGKKAPFAIRVASFKKGVCWAYFQG